MSDEESKNINNKSVLIVDDDADLVEAQGPF